MKNRLFTLILFAGIVPLYSAALDSDTIRELIAASNKDDTQDSARTVLHFLHRTQTSNKKPNVEVKKAAQTFGITLTRAGISGTLTRLFVTTGKHRGVQYRYQEGVPQAAPPPGVEDQHREIQKQQTSPQDFLIMAIQATLAPMIKQANEQKRPNFDVAAGDICPVSTLENFIVTKNLPSLNIRIQNYITKAFPHIKPESVVAIAHDHLKRDPATKNFHWES